jgi:hypothetical protein
MECETTYPDYPDWLGRATLTGFFVGAFGLGIAALLTADNDSLLFSPGDQAMFGAVLGAIGGVVAGFLAWAIAALVVLFRRVARRLAES